MRRFLINLDRSADRLGRMEQEFLRVGVDFTRIAAIDGERLSAEDVAGFARQRPTLPWVGGQIGAFLSHAAVWTRIANGDDAVAAIFEDDVHLADDIGVLLASERWIPSDADVVRLEGMGNMKLTRGRKIHVCQGRRLHRAISGAWGSAGYVLTRKAAAALVAAPPEHHVHADHFLFTPRLSPVAAKLHRYQIVPSVCVQDQVARGAESGIESLIFPGKEIALPKPKRRNLISVLRPYSKVTVAFRP